MDITRRLCFVVAAEWFSTSINHNEIAFCKKRTIRNLFLCAASVKRSKLQKQKICYNIRHSVNSSSENGYSESIHNETAFAECEDSKNEFRCTLIQGQRPWLRGHTITHIYLCLIENIECVRVLSTTNSKTEHVLWCTPRGMMWIKQSKAKHSRWCAIDLISETACGWVYMYGVRCNTFQHTPIRFEIDHRRIAVCKIDGVDWIDALCTCCAYYVRDESLIDLVSQVTWAEALHNQNRIEFIACTFVASPRW